MDALQNHYKTIAVTKKNRDFFKPYKSHLYNTSGRQDETFASRSVPWLSLVQIEDVLSRDWLKNWIIIVCGWTPQWHRDR